VRAQAVHQDQRAASALHGAEVAGSQAPIDFGTAQAAHTLGIRYRKRQWFKSGAASIQAASVFVGSAHRNVPLYVSRAGAMQRAVSRDEHERSEAISLWTVQ
jgi:hypothetical protein